MQSQPPFLAAEQAIPFSRESLFKLPAFHQSLTKAGRSLSWPDQPKESSSTNETIALIGGVVKFDQNHSMQFILAIVFAFAAVPAYAKPLVCSLTEGKEQSRLNAKARNIRAGDDFFMQLVAWNGEPSACKGSVSGDPLFEEHWLVFSWPDGSSYESIFQQPENSAIRYTRAAGLGGPDDVIARARKSAAEFGLHIDWNTPESTVEGDAEVTEYRDPRQGLNGIVRLIYNRQHRLIEVAVSMAP